MKAKTGLFSASRQNGKESITVNYQKQKETGLPDRNKRLVRIRWITSAGLLLTAVAITILSLLPDPPQPDLDIPFQDKIEHFIAYAALGGLTVGSFWSRMRRPLILAAAIILSVAFGGVLEILQSFTGRSTELGDLIADFLGAVLGATAGLLIFKRICRRAAA